jgi:hypothetical protein
MGNLRKYIKVFIILILPVYLLLLANSMMNMHVHVLSGGMVVRHAHPFKTDAGSGEAHHHSSKDCSFYQGFFLGYFDTSEPYQKLTATIYVAAIIGEPSQEDYSFETAAWQNLRGPPEL